MPIAATTVALGGAIAAALAWIVTRDDDDDELDDETPDLSAPNIATVDLTYLDEDEGDLVIETEPYVPPVVPKVSTFTPSQSGYPRERLRRIAVPRLLPNSHDAQVPELRRTKRGAGREIADRATSGPREGVPAELQPGQRARL